MWTWSENVNLVCLKSKTTTLQTFEGKLLPPWYLFAFLLGTRNRQKLVFHTGTVLSCWTVVLQLCLVSVHEEDSINGVWGESGVAFSGVQVANSWTLFAITMHKVPHVTVTATTRYPLPLKWEFLVYFCCPFCFPKKTLKWYSFYSRCHKIVPFFGIYERIVDEAHCCDTSQSLPILIGWHSKVTSSKGASPHLWSNSCTD